MIELSFVGRIPVDLYVDPSDYRGLTSDEILSNLQDTLRRVAVGIELNDEDVKRAATLVAAKANIQTGEVWSPETGIPHFIDVDY